MKSINVILVSVLYMSCLFYCLLIIISCITETRALAIAMVNSIGNLAPNFINVAAWTVTQAPAFRLGKIVTTATTAAMIVMCAIVYILERYKILLPKAQQRIETESMEKKEEH